MDVSSGHRPYCFEGETELVLAMKLGNSGIVSKRTAGELLIEGVRKGHVGKVGLTLRRQQRQ